MVGQHDFSIFPKEKVEKMQANQFLVYLVLPFKCGTYYFIYIKTKNHFQFFIFTKINKVQHK